MQKYILKILFCICLKQWNNSEDRIGLVGLGFAAIVAIWASSNLIVVITEIFAGQN